MTIHEGLIAALKKEFPNHGFVENAGLQGYPIYRDGRPEKVVRDAPDDLMLDFGVLNDLVQRICDYNYMLLDKENVDELVYILDRKTAAPKYASRSKELSIPKTPLEATQTTNPHLAWKRYFDANYTNPNSVAPVLENLSSIQRVPLPYSGYERPANWDQFLKNRHFKEFISGVLCDAVFRQSKIPVGKSLVVLGPFGFAKKRNVHEELELDECYKADYWEADYMTVWIANNFHRTHHITIYSKDGDVWMANLLSQTRRIINVPTGDVDSVDFGGEVVVVRHWRERNTAFAYVNIGQLWRSIQKHAIALTSFVNNGSAEFRFNAPVATYVFTMLLLKNDYVEGFNWITPVRYFAALRKKLGLIGMPLVAGTESADSLRVNCDAALRLVFYAYGEALPKLNVDPCDIDTTAHNVREQLNNRKSNKATFSLELFKVAIANAHWFMSYMIAAQDGKLPSTGLETDKESGLSLHGYALQAEISDNNTYYGVLSVGRPLQVALEHLALNNDK